MTKLKHFLFVDFETYYDRDYSLRKMSPPEYILDPRFEVLMLAVYDPLAMSAPQILQVDQIVEFLEGYPAAETICCSHNALFDLSILAWHYGWIAGRLQDTLGMVRALRNYTKNSLGAVAEQLLGYNSKDDTVYKVIGMHAQDIKNAGLWPRMVSYALNDVRLCSFIYAKLEKEFPEDERQIMDLTVRCAIQPTLHADTFMLEKHLGEVRKRKERLLRECNFDRAALMSTRQFQEALEELGVEVKTKLSKTGRWVPAFAKSDPFMAELMEYDKSEDDEINYAVQTLAAARLSHKSTIEETRAEKFVNIAKLPWGNGGHMLPVALRYGGAHTHRLSGEWGMNMQNLPRDKTKSRLRAALLAPPGHKLVTADLSQIEARIVAQLCGQQDLVEQFRAGEDVYARFASHVFRRSVNKKSEPNERFIGKVSILGLGYGCGGDRFYQMVVTQARAAGIMLDDLFDEKLAHEIVNAYRLTFSCISRTWKELDHYLNRFINNSLKTQFTRWSPVVFRSGEIELPNQMTLRYKLKDEHLYGAKILENIVQSLARIVVMGAALRLAQRGYRFCLQAHDELCFVVPDDQVEEAKKIIAEEMIREPEWLKGLPLAVEVGSGVNYADCK